MSDTVTLYLLRAIHVVSGVLWVGVVVFTAAFLMPAVEAVGPAGGALMQHLVRVQRLPFWILGSMLLTVFSGITLYWHDSAGFQSAWLASGPGRVFGLGGALGITAGLVGMVVNAPTARRLGQIAAEAAGQPTPDQAAEMQRLQGRLRRVGNALAVLVLLATLCMAVARYVP